MAKVYPCTCFVPSINPSAFVLDLEMSLPHYRGTTSHSNNTDMHRAGDKGRVDEVNQSLLEQQNDQRWVCVLPRISSDLCVS